MSSFDPEAFETSVRLTQNQWEEERVKRERAIEHRENEERLRNHGTARRQSEEARKILDMAEFVAERALEKAVNCDIELGTGRATISSYLSGGPGKKVNIHPGWMLSHYVPQHTQLTEVEPGKNRLDTIRRIPGTALGSDGRLHHFDRTEGVFGHVDEGLIIHTETDDTPFDTKEWENRLTEFAARNELL